MAWTHTRDSRQEGRPASRRRAAQANRIRRRRLTHQPLVLPAPYSCPKPSSFPAVTTAEVYVSPARVASSHGRGRYGVLAVAMGLLAAALPLVGLVSLLLRDQLDLGWSNHAVHFAVFMTVGVGVFVLAYAAGEAANRRGDARVLLISLAFLATGGFLGLHAVGTAGISSRTSMRGSRSRTHWSLFSPRCSHSRPALSISASRSRRSWCDTAWRCAVPCSRPCGVVRLDGRRAAAAARAWQRGRLAQRACRAGRPWRRCLRHRGCSLLVRLSRAERLVAGQRDRLLCLARR